MAVVRKGRNPDGTQRYACRLRAAENRGHRQYARDWWLQRRYGMTQAEYDVMSLHQGHVCAVCRQPCTKNEGLSVDHDHATGRVRGLLCNSCNRGIGYLRDNPQILRAAATYLEEI